MKTQPIEPAQIDFDAGGGAPRAPRYGDVYHPQVGALEQARHVFLQGNGLPARWAARPRFVILETGFGLGNNFLATWAAWRADAARCERLCYVSIERHPPRAADLVRAHAGSALPELAAALIQAWPPLTPNLHTLEFEGGRVQLLLALGDVALLLPGLRVHAHAFFLDGFAPDRNPAMWQPRVLAALGRKAAPDATLATWSVAREVRDGLSSAGFEVRRAAGIGGKREITVARYAPRHAPRPLPHATVASRDAVVVGAGIAGAAAAHALARAGVAVTVFERHDTPAAEASGNPAGLFHGAVHGDDGVYARLYRAAAMQADRDYAAAGARRFGTGGLLRLHTHPAGLAAMTTLLERLNLPPDCVQALDAAEASRRAGVALAAPAWFYPRGGAIDPGGWVRDALREPRVRLIARVEIARISRHAGRWRLHDRAGRVVAESALVVLANAASTGALLAPLGLAGWPFEQTRGQVTYWTGAADPPECERGAQPTLQMPVAGAGYAIPMPDGGLLCGATNEIGTRGGAPVSPPDSVPDAGFPAPPLREEAQRLNIERLHALTGIAAPRDRAAWQGRAGWRLQTDDRLPIAGALACAISPEGQRLDQARLLARESGLFVLTALGSRGLTLAPLLGRLIAAQATGAPWPLEQDLADAVDPARWRVRAARAAAAAGSAQPAVPD